MSTPPQRGASPAASSHGPGGSGSPQPPQQAAHASGTAAQGSARPSSPSRASPRSASWRRQQQTTTQQTARASTSPSQAPGTAARSSRSEIQATGAAPRGQEDSDQNPVAKAKLIAARLNKAERSSEGSPRHYRLLVQEGNTSSA
jgi:hypothetical protein